MISRALVSLATAGVLLLSACGGGDSGSSDGTVPSDADLVVKAVEGIAWDAPEYTAAAGDVVISVNNASSLPHNLHIVASDGTELPQVFDVPSRGDVATDTVALTAGAYTLICTIPGHANMKATLTVS